MVNKDSYYDLKWHISNSSLKCLLQSPKKFKDYLEGTNEQLNTKSTTLGTLVHMYVLERDKFDAEVEVMEVKMPSVTDKQLVCLDIADGLNEVEAYRKYYSTKEDDKKVQAKVDKLKEEYPDYIEYLKKCKEKQVISTETLRQVESIAESLKGHKLALKLLFHTPSEVDMLEDIERHNEKAILFKYKDVDCKALLDRLIIDREAKTITLVDLKTTSYLSNFNESFNKLRYDIQLAFYSLALTLGIEDIEDYKFLTYIVAVDSGTKQVKVYNFSNEYMLQKATELKDLLDRAVYHITNDKWDYNMEYYEGDGAETM